MLERTVCNDSTYLREYAKSGWSQGCNDVFNRVENEVSDDVEFDDLLLPKCLSTPSSQQFKTRGLHQKAHSSVQTCFSLASEPKMFYLFPNFVCDLFCFVFLFITDGQNQNHR